MSMKITVEMDEETYAEFAKYRKDKEIYTKSAEKEINGLRARMTHLAKAVLDSANAKTQKAKKEAKEYAIEYANDWLY